MKLFKFPFAFGALGGLTWFLLYDILLCPHGNVTLPRHLTAYGIAGGLASATLYNPGSLVYGAIGGIFYGMYKLTSKEPAYPSNYYHKIENFDEEKREKAFRDDEEYLMTL